jgi:hypothetical protein
MTATPFERVLVGYLATEPGADARALAVDLAVLCGADVLLVTVVSAVWLEHPGEQTGLAVVHGGTRERSALALKEAAAELADVSGLGGVERRLEASRSPARGLHDTALADRPTWSWSALRTTGRWAGCCWAQSANGCWPARRVRSP